MSKRLDTLKCAYEAAKSAYEKALYEDKRKGIYLKEGEWLKILVFDDQNSLKPEETLIFYHTPSSGVVAMNGYFDNIEEGCVSGIINQAPVWETWKAEKISKEEAIKFL